MKTRLLVILLMFGTGVAYANEPEPVGVNVFEYGIFDPNDNNTSELKVGEKYNIKVLFESELDKPISFTYFVQVKDKNKHVDEIVDEFSTSGRLEPGESKVVSFAWTPKYEGQFRTFAGISNNANNMMVGGIPQFDFEVVVDESELHDYFPTIKIMNLKERYLPNEPITPYILRKDLNACNAYRAEIIKDKIRVWSYDSASSCVVMDPPNEVESTVQIPRTREPIMLSEMGEYTLRVEIAGYKLQEKFGIGESIDFRNAEGEIICKGYSSGGGFFEYPECGPIDQFVINVLIIVLPIAGFVIGFVVWRKRK